MYSPKSKNAHLLVWPSQNFCHWKEIHHGDTEAFSKLAELVALPNKEAQTVAEALFNRWICRYGLPEEILSDGGKEFCNDTVNLMLK